MNLRSDIPSFVIDTTLATINSLNFEIQYPKLELQARARWLLVWAAGHIRIWCHADEQNLHT